MKRITYDQGLAILLGKRVGQLDADLRVGPSLGAPPNTQPSRKHLWVQRLLAGLDVPPKTPGALALLETHRPQVAFVLDVLVKRVVVI